MMKVVLFCGGLGMRMRDGVSTAPKPMAMIGERPLIWHVMRYYAHFGHTDFVLCLGYKGHMIKEYFLNYRLMSGDFTLNLSTPNEPQFHNANQHENWTIVFADTGLVAGAFLEFAIPAGLQG